jgi:hypothetical protein
LPPAIAQSLKSTHRAFWAKTIDLEILLLLFGDWARFIRRIAHPFDETFLAERLPLVHPLLGTLSRIAWTLSRTGCKIVSLWRLPQ